MEKEVFEESTGGLGEETTNAADGKRGSTWSTNQEILPDLCHPQDNAPSLQRQQWR